MATKKNLKSVTLPEFEPTELGIPFKVMLLESVKQVFNPTTGKVEETIIPNVPGLLRCAATARILESRKLSGPELKFVRKAFKVSAKGLAEKIGVTPEHLSRCEAGERVLSAGAEKCLRISLFLDNHQLPPNIEELADGNEKVEKYVEIYEKAFAKIRNVLNDMNINVAHSIDDELILSFRVSNPLDEDLFEDDLSADWSENDQHQSVAA
jgi:DNA-binding transcriptional regulator YiaG